MPRSAWLWNGWWALIGCGIEGRSWCTSQSDGLAQRPDQPPFALSQSQHRFRPLTVAAGEQMGGAFRVGAQTLLMHGILR